MTQSLRFGWCLVLLAGCGGGVSPPDFGGEDGRQIADLVDRMNDDSDSPREMKAMFATGTPLGKKELALYPEFTYTLKGRVAVAGEAATGTVEVRSGDGKRRGEKEWAFVKEGGTWKIKAAPMP